MDIRSTDKDDFRFVFDRDYPLLVDVAYHIVWDLDTAEDLAEEAFERFFMRSMSFPSADDARYWLLRVVKNLALNFLRRNKRELEVVSSVGKEELSYNESGESNLIRNEERRLVRKDQMVLHCAYVEYRGEAILFSAPSETGKTTQAGLWEKYRGSRTVNGDRSLLGKKEGRWIAQGWPVCGTSEVCHNEAIPIKAVIMLSQAKENRAEKLKPGQAFPLLYSQITVNKWNMQDHLHTMDLIDSFLREVPVYHLGCTISEEAVECLAGVMTL